MKKSFVSKTFDYGHTCIRDDQVCSFDCMYACIRRRTCKSFVSKYYTWILRSCSIYSPPKAMYLAYFSCHSLKTCWEPLQIIVRIVSNPYSSKYQTKKGNICDFLLKVGFQKKSLEARSGGSLGVQFRFVQELRKCMCHIWGRLLAWCPFEKVCVWTIPLSSKTLLSLTFNIELDARCAHFSSHSVLLLYSLV